MSQKKALVIDGNSLFYRIYYATTNLVDFALQHNLTPNNAIKLMINVVLKYLADEQYEYYFIAFDDREKTFRHHSLDTYKSNRTKAPDDLYNQMNDTIVCLKALGVNVMQKPQIEADDLVGSFVNVMNQANITVDVISSDKDMLQLVNKQCNVHLIKKGISDLDEYNINNFAQKYHGLAPYQVIEYKAIVGDSSDSLPGVNGIGPKTGIDLLTKYQSLDNIFAHLHELSSSIQTKFNNAKDMAYKCKQLATILNDQLQEFKVDDFALKALNSEIIRPIIDKYKLKQLDEYLLLSSQDKLF